MKKNKWQQKHIAYRGYNHTQIYHILTYIFLVFEKIKLNLVHDDPLQQRSDT